MDKKQALASYNNWKQTNKRDNGNMSDNEEVNVRQGIVRSMSIRLSYEKEDDNSKRSSKMPKLISRSKRSIKERRCPKFPTVIPKKLFGRKKRQKDDWNKISILPTINEVEDTKYRQHMGKQREKGTTNESNSSLLDATYEVTLRHTKTRKNEEKALTHWEKVVYEKICSEESRLYFVYFLVFIVLACALVGSISVVQFVYQKGRDSVNGGKQSNISPRIVYSMLQNSNKSDSLNISNNTHLIEEMEKTMERTPEEENGVRIRSSIKGDNGSINDLNDTMLLQNINSTGFFNSDSLDTSRTIKPEDSTKPGIFLEHDLNININATRKTVDGSDFLTFDPSNIRITTVMVALEEKSKFSHEKEKNMINKITERNDTGFTSDLDKQVTTEDPRNNASEHNQLIQFENTTTQGMIDEIQKPSMFSVLNENDIYLFNTSLYQ